MEKSVINKKGTLKDEWYGEIYICGHCGIMEIWSHFKYCPNCGLELVWDTMDFYKEDDFNIQIKNNT